MYFLICLQVWLCSGQGKLLLFLTPCFFFSHMQLKSARPQIHIDSFALFCKLKISHSFDADRNAVLCSPPCSWKQRLSRPAFPLFFIYIYLYIFLTHLPDSEKRKKRGKRNPLNPWMDSHQRHVRLRERQKGRAMDTGGDVGERCFGGGSGSRRAKLLEWNDEKQEIRGDKIRRWDSSMHLITKKERREGKVMEAGSGKGVWRCVRLDAIEAYLC